ncbi:MAG TPA: DUF2905 domain-containing protein [Bacteroidota bacterium]|nr:DUF2905 domain-containing protein [Bacteroidota bacterium]
MAPFGKILVVLGFIIVGVGILFMYSDKIPFVGRLPGDISIKKENFHLYVPITTSIIISIVLSLIIWVISFFSKK